jgi:hypothetical protein
VAALSRGVGTAVGAGILVGRGVGTGVGVAAGVGMGEAAPSASTCCRTNENAGWRTVTVLAEKARQTANTTGRKARSRLTWLGYRMRGNALNSPNPVLA